MSVAWSVVQVELPLGTDVPSELVPPGQTTGFSPEDAGQLQPLYLRCTMSFFLMTGPEPALMVEMRRVLGLSSSWMTMPGCPLTAVITFGMPSSGSWLI